MSFASYGAWVDVAAPGNGIRSAIPRDGYANWSGTSMATPFVAGEAALIRSDGVAPSLSPEDVEALIRATARPLDALNPTYAGMLGSGEANAGANLDRLRPGICW